MHLKKSLKKNQLEIAIVLVLFFGAFAIRMIPSGSFPNMYGADTMWSSRHTKHLIQGGWFIYLDSTTDYPWGREQPASEIGWWTMNAIAYTMAGGAAYPFNYDLFAYVASMMTVIFGSLAIPIVYLLSKEMFGRIAGLSSALILMGINAHILYSMFGHAENDGLGFTLFFLCVLAFILCFRKRNWKYGLFVVLSFTWLSLVWQSYNVLLLMVAGTTALYFMLYALFNAFGYYKNSSSRDDMRKWMMYGLAFGMVSVVIETIIKSFRGMAPMGVLTLGGALFTCCLIEWLVHRKQGKFKLISFNIKDMNKNYIGVLFILSLLFMGSMTVVHGLYCKEGAMTIIDTPLSFIGLQSRGGTLLPYEERMHSTISEQQPVAGENIIDRISNIGGVFGTVIWLTLISILLILVKLMIIPITRKDFDHWPELFALFFILFSIIMLTKKAISMFFLSAGIVLGAGYLFQFIANVIKYIRKGNSNDKLRIIADLFFVAMLVYSASYVVSGIGTANSINYNIPQKWFETFDWINENMEEGSVITAWWDYGHWMNYWVGDKVYTSLDNIQDRKDIIYTVASAFTHTPPCEWDGEGMKCPSSSEDLEKAELESLSLLKQLNSTHILIDREIMTGKFMALARIADKFNTGCFRSLTQESLMMDDEELNNIINVNWPGTVMEKVRVFIKNGTNGHDIYTPAFYSFDEYGRVIGCDNPYMTAPIMYTFQARLFFKDPSLKHVDLVYDNGWNVIYKVNWDEIPDPENYTDWTRDKMILCTGLAERRCEESVQYRIDYPDHPY